MNVPPVSIPILFNPGHPFNYNKVNGNDVLFVFWVRLTVLGRRMISSATILNCIIPIITIILVYLEFFQYNYIINPQFKDTSVV